MDFLIVEARYHGYVADRLLDGATAALEKGGGHFERISVPGVLEIAPAIAMAARGPRPFTGYVALGCVIGEGGVVDALYRESLRGLMTIATEGVAIGSAILLAGSESAVLAAVEEGDAGGEAARAALALATLQARLGYFG